MKIAPLPMTNPWLRRSLNKTAAQPEMLPRVPLDTMVHMELVELLHEGPESNYRPYLHLQGEMTEATLEVEVPYGITKLDLGRGRGLPVDMFYAFSDEQLTRLVGQGYFLKGFKIPDTLSGFSWGMPGMADMVIIGPEVFDQPPLVFVSLHDQRSLALDEASSGYDLVDYIPPYSLAAEAQVEVESSEHDLGADVDESYADLFADEVFDTHRPTFDDGLAVKDKSSEQLVPDSIFDRLVAELDSSYATSAVDQSVPVEPVRDIVIENVADVELESDPEAEPVFSALESLYRERVAPAVEQVINPELEFDLEADIEFTDDEADLAKLLEDDVNDAVEFDSLVLRDDEETEDLALRRAQTRAEALAAARMETDETFTETDGASILDNEMDL